MYAAKHNSNRTNRKLTFQSLESRQLMAGNVAVSVLSSGDLRITGDDQANDVAIFQTMQQGHVIPGSYFVTGLNGTTINGGSGQTFTGITRDFKVNMVQGGDDHVAMGFVDGFDPSASNANFIVPRNLSVNFDTNGNNTLQLKGITVGDNTSIKAGAGNNTFDLRGTFGVINPLSSKITQPINKNGHGNLTILAGGGDEHLQLHNGSVLHDASIKLGGGQSGLDSVGVVAMNIGRNFNIHSGGGRDMNLIAVQGVHVGHDLTIAGGIAKDIVTVGNTTVADRLFASLGHGEDFLDVEDSHAASAFLSGGQDFDTLHQVDNQFATQPVIDSFEHIQ